MLKHISLQYEYFETFKSQHIYYYSLQEQTHLQTPVTQLKFLDLHDYVLDHSKINLSQNLAKTEVISLTSYLNLRYKTFKCCSEKNFNSNNQNI